MAERRQGFHLRNPILNTLFTARGNQSVCLWTEPMWGIPFNLMTPLAAVYMAAVGLDPVQIGTVATVSLISQMLSSSVSGVLTDKLGRRLCTAIFDVLAWVVPCALWAAARSYWYFFLAAVFNGFWRVTNNSWSLLLTEDADPDKLIHLYTISNIAGMIAGFVAPLTGIFVERFTVISTMRVIYVFFGVSMAVKCWLLYAISRETSVGVRRREETKGKSLFSSLYESRFVLRGMLQSRRIMLTVALSTCFILIKSVNDNFWPLLITEKLGISESLLPSFSALRTLIMLLLYLTVVPRLDARAFRRPLTLSMGILLLVGVILFYMEKGALAMVWLCVALEGVALSTLTPLLPTLIMQAMDRVERARMLALATTMSLLVSAPFGTVAGLLSKMNRGLPMLLNVALAALSIFLATRLEREAAPLPRG